MAEKRGPLSGLSILLWEAVPLPSGSQAACQASLSSPSPQLRHAEPLAWSILTGAASRGTRRHLAGLCSDMPLPEARGFQKLGRLICRGLPQRVPGVSSFSVTCAVGRWQECQSAPCQPCACWLLRGCQGPGLGLEERGRRVHLHHPGSDRCCPC